MPIYKYKCRGCHGEFEKLVPRVSDAPVQCVLCKEHRDKDLADRPAGQFRLSVPLADKVYSVPGKFKWGRSGGWN